MPFEPYFVFSKYSYAGKDDTFFDENEAVIQLLQQGICFVGSKTQIVVMCSDVFAWACADAEEIEDEKELEELYRWCVKYPNYGGVIWCCIKRNQKPQAPYAKLMKDNNEWDIVLDNLSENNYDAYIQKEYGNKERNS